MYYFIIFWVARYVLVTCERSTIDYYGWDGLLQWVAGWSQAAYPSPVTGHSSSWMFQLHFQICLYKMRIYFINLKTGFFYIWFIGSIGKYFVISVYEGSSGWLLFSLICVDFCTLWGIPVMAYFYSSAIMSTIHTSKYFKFFTLHLFGFWFCSQYLLALCKNVWHVLFV